MEKKLAAKRNLMKSFSASLDQLYNMLGFIRDYAESIGFESSDISKIELAAEEALVNIVSYGYPNREGKIEISCTFIEEGSFKIVIKDHGVPYNPLANAKKFDFQNAIDDHTIGGYGVYFILKIMDEVNYKRDKESNILTLIKYLS